jgi:hypothetical protein
MVIFMMAAAGQLLGTGAISTYNTCKFGSMMQLII